MDEFSVYLEDLVLCPKALVIAGDFNLHIDDPAGADVRQFADLLATFGLIQHVTFATHVSGHWLDLIIARSSSDVVVVAPCPSSFLSDHCFVECSLAIPSAAETATEISFRKWKDIYTETFVSDNANSELARFDDSELAEGYGRILSSILNTHAPLRRNVIVSRPRVPWFNDKLKSVKSIRRKLEKRMRRTNLASDIRAYRAACNRCCLHLNEAKRKRYGDHIEDCAGDSNNLFGVVTLSAMCMLSSSSVRQFTSTRR